jgi:hypothetical protein
MASRVPWDPASYLALARRACFVCELLAGNPDYPHHVAYRDDVAIDFASRFPSVTGHFLVAPADHREHAITDFTPDEYAAIQRGAPGGQCTRFAAARRAALRPVARQPAGQPARPLAPRPAAAGVPYEDQQIALFEASRGHLDLPDDEVADLARRLGEHMAN